MLSIIVPVYNDEKYLDRCVNSILKQTFTDFELLLIDDGSTDNSPHMCDDYATMDSRVKVIHQNNQGITGARNTGIEAATGDYIAFMDHDDWLDGDMYEKLMKTAQEYDADIVKCGINYTDGEDQNSRYTYGEGLKVYQGNQIIEQFFVKRHVLIWNAVYRAEIAKKVVYPDTNRLMDGHEDNYAAFFYCLYAKKMVLRDDTFYNYHQNDASFSRAIETDSNQRYLKVDEEIRKTIIEKNIVLPQWLANKLEWLWAKHYYHYIRDDQSVKTIKKEVKQRMLKALDTRRKYMFRFLLWKRNIATV